MVGKKFGFLISSRTRRPLTRVVYLSLLASTCQEPHTIGIPYHPSLSWLIYLSVPDISPYFRRRVGYIKSVSRNYYSYLLISLTYCGRVCIQSNIWLWAYRHLRAWKGHCCCYHPEEGARKCLLHKSPLQSLRVL